VSGLWELARFERGTEVRMAGDTLPQLFRNAASARAGKVWMREKKLGIWREWRWDEAATVVREIAMGLAAIGLQPGQTASILSNTVVEWVLADLGVLCAGGVSATASTRPTARRRSPTCAPTRPRA
jgi:long-chain acyl-CoA synthetase